MDQMLTDAGKVSVPISSILDALKDTLSEEKRAALFTQLIGLRPAGVAPGDLITAELFNQMMSDINGLAIRVAALEGVAGGPVIERIEPVGANKEAGSLLTIIGANFKPDDEDMFVSVGHKKVTDFFAKSDQKKLLLTVPVSFAQLPVTVPVTVTVKGRTSNSVSITIVPEVVTPSGNVQVEYQGGNLGTIGVGQTYQLVWRVWSNLNLPSSFEVEPEVTGVSGGSSVDQWLAAIQVPSTQFSIEPGGFHDVTMTVTVPTGAENAEINLRAESIVGNFVGAAQTPFTMQVGEETPVSDQRATVAMRQVSVTEFRSGNVIVADKLVMGFKIQPGKTVNLPFQVSAALDIGGPGTPQERSGEGHYRFTAQVKSGSQDGRFTAQPMSATRTFVAKNSTQNFEVPVAAAATPTDTTVVTWIEVTATCYPDASSNTPRFTSFTRVPLVGKT
ncbi:MAG TPA: IPT/TIG domain-containing protein [Allosphingosinicella sp.]|jgi:hypothetical protein